MGTIMPRPSFVTKAAIHVPATVTALKSSAGTDTAIAKRSLAMKAAIRSLAMQTVRNCPIPPI